MIDRYREMDVMTASPTTLVVKLYEGALRNARTARVEIEAGRIPERARALDKSFAIVAELQSSLDFERGGEIAIQLNDLYGFVNARLLEANLNVSIEAIDDAIRVLETLLEGWQQISQSAPAPPAAAGDTP